MSYTSNQINQQSLNGILQLTDGVITIEDGIISGATKITAVELNSDLLISTTANIGTLGVGNLDVNKLTGNVISSQSNYATYRAGYSLSSGYINGSLLQCDTAYIKKGNITNAMIENENVGNATIQNADITNATIQTANIISLVISSLNLIPPGTIQMTVVNSVSPPTGWLYCRGDAVSKTTYAVLYAAIGGLYGQTLTTFNLPNFRGAFLRGYNEIGNAGSAITGYDTGNIGQYVIDNMRQHYHQLYYPDPLSTEPVAQGGATAQDNVDITTDTTGYRDDRGLFPITGQDTVPYHSMVNFIIKF